MEGMNQEEYIRNTKSMKKAQFIVDKLVSETPELNKLITNDSIIKPSKNLNRDLQLAQPNKKNEILDLFGKGDSRDKNPYDLIKNKNEMTAVDWQEKCEKYDELLKKQKERNDQLIIELNTRQERYVKREIEYRKIIEDLQNEIKQKSKISVSDLKK